jgi:Integrase core domain
VERFHKTMKREFLAGKRFETIADAQRALDGWVDEYNHQREHQSLGDRPPIERFRLAHREPLEMVAVDPDASHPAPVVSSVPRNTRQVGSNGRISFAAFNYHVGRWLAGATVEVAVRDGLVEIHHDGVLVATHARRHPPDKEPTVRRALRARPASVVVTRKVDGSGSVSFAGWSYRVGNAYRGRQVEVSIVGDSVQISFEGRLVKTHPVRHDRSKEHGAFANPGGRPRRTNAA